MDLYTLLSSNKEVTGSFTYVLAIFVALGAYRVYKDKASNPSQQYHLTLLCFGLIVASLTFLKPVWGFWSGLLSACMFFWAYALTSSPKQSVSRSIKQVASFAMAVSVVGMVSGVSPSLSLGPRMWPQTSKTPSFSMLNTHAYTNEAPTYGDDVEFTSQNIPALDPSGLSSWGKGSYRKRVWALGGDTIRITSTTISINGDLVADCSHPRPQDIIQRIPSLVYFCHAKFPNGKTQRFVWGEANSFLYPTLEIEVDQGEIFVMGDNTVESGDSREYGPILSDWILGSFDEPPTSQSWKAW